MLCKNTSNGPLEFDIDGAPGHRPRHYSVGADEVVDIPDGYCQAYLSSTQRKQAPIIERLAPGMKVLPPKQQAKARAAAGAVEGRATAEEAGAVAAIMARFDDVVGELKSLKATNKQLVERVAELEDRADAADEEDDADAELPEVAEPKKGDADTKGNTTVATPPPAPEGKKADKAEKGTGK